MLKSILIILLRFFNISIKIKTYWIAGKVPIQTTYANYIYGHVCPVTKIVRKYGFLWESIAIEFSFS